MILKGHYIDNDENIAIASDPGFMISIVGHSADPKEGVYLEAAFEHPIHTSRGSEKEPPRRREVRRHPRVQPIRSAGSTQPRLDLRLGPSILARAH
jgi:hypothetical protein